MKDRIKQIMESQHMTQQVFAEFIGIAPATLSGIFTERTKPTINTVEAIKKKLPSINTDWLMFGREPMYVDQEPAETSRLGRSEASKGHADASKQDSLFDFSPVSAAPTPQSAVRAPQNQAGTRPVRMEIGVQDVNSPEKAPRKVTEIRVFYDDQTWESFIPAKK
ncbi:MAG: helix-turn-helix transcriptional regulator [Prevotella sp.]|nr:helix-turn-helix transcriptional regulator [Prevotella sp.]